MRDASLDEFVDPGMSDGDVDESDESEADADVREPEPTDSESEGDDETPSESVDPAEPTFDFAPDGADCEGCGEVVRRRWREGDGMVCADCKEW
jgi:hypothetical protein